MSTAELFGIVGAEDVAYRAMLFARAVHATQQRKYTGNPYTDHLSEVAGIVATVSTAPLHLAVAWLHDCVEDQGIKLEQLTRLFGSAVAYGVRQLSDMEEGNRAERKRLARERLGKSPAWVQTIKCADLISNTASIVRHDSKFAVTYLEEKRLLLDVLTQADKRLWNLAAEQCK